MSQQSEFITVAKLVKNLLTLHPELRDDDNLLLAKIWRKETIGLIPYDGCSDPYKVFDWLEDGKYTNAKTIVRARRKVQETFPKLRGEKYEERQRSQKDWINQLSMFDL